MIQSISIHSNATDSQGVGIVSKTSTMCQHRHMKETVSLNSRRSGKQCDGSTRAESKMVVNTLIEVPPPRLSHAAGEGAGD